MYRKFVAAVALVVFAGTLSAAEVRGRVKSVDAKKGTITITTGRGDAAKDQTLMLAKDAKFTSMNKELATKLSTQGLKHEIFSKTGRMATFVVLVTEGEGAKAVVKEVRVIAGRRRPQPPK
jgi:hypothetical protein